MEIGNREVFKVRHLERKSLNKQVWKRHLKEAKVQFRAVTT
jgi:hypothetical protein